VVREIDQRSKAIALEGWKEKQTEEIGRLKVLIEAKDKELMNR
jgi:hypothetical protein